MEKFRSAERLHQKREFDDAFRFGRRYHTPHFSLIIRKSCEHPTRLGLSISKKAGIAVERNKLKRWSREIFRRNRSLFSDHADIVILVTRPVRATYSQLRSAMLEAAARAL